MGVRVGVLRKRGLCWCVCMCGYRNALRACLFFEPCRIDVFYQDLLNQLVWPANAWAMEVLVGMAESHFLELSDVLDKEIIKYGRCPKQRL